MKPKCSAHPVGINMFWADCEQQKSALLAKLPSMLICSKFDVWFYALCRD